MIHAPAPKDYATWRGTARELLAHHHAPTDVLWNRPTEPALWENASDPTVNETADTLLTALPPSNAPDAVTKNSTPVSSAPKTPDETVRVPREFPLLARLVAAHADLSRWEVLYRVLWRLTHGEPALLRLITDPDVHRLLRWEKAVRRELHKLTAFVRFRAVRADDGHEHYIAWYEPEHDVIALGAPFFQRRFTSMHWSILSPRRCVHWDGHTLCETPGVPRSEAPLDDALEPLWRTYYASIFNPARLKTNAMLREMPRRYWKNLPESELIEQLIADAAPRTSAKLPSH
jgi:uracil-DNA glycosylase